MYSCKISKHFSSVQTSQESATWIPGFQIFVSKNFSEWWKNEKAL